MMLFVGCASTSQAPATREESADLVWPEPPSEQRIAFVTSFTGTEDLGIKKGFLQQLRVLISGRSEERLVRPMAVVESPGDRYFVVDPGVRGVHLFDIGKGKYRLVQRENGEPLPSPVRQSKARWCRVPRSPAAMRLCASRYHGCQRQFSWTIKTTPAA